MKNSKRVNNNNNNTGDTSSFISFCLLLLATWGKRYNSQKPILTVLCWHPLHTHTCTAHLVVSKIATHLYRSRPKRIFSDLIRKTQLLASTVGPPLFSKSWNSLDHPFQITTDLFRSRSKLSYSDQIKKTQLFALTLEPQIIVFFKILKSSGHLFRTRRHPPTQFTPRRFQPHFLSRVCVWGGYYDRWWLLYPFRASVQVNRLTITPKLRDSESFKALKN